MRKPTAAMQRVLDLLQGRTLTFRELEFDTRLSNTGLRVILGQLVKDGRVQRTTVQQPPGKKGAPFYQYSITPAVAA